MRAALAFLALLTAGLIALAAPAARAQSMVVSERPEKVAVVLYRDRFVSTEQLREDGDCCGLQGLVLVTETRTVDLPAGVSKISFRGVAEGMVPQTASLDGLPADILERNHDYNLLSPGSLLEHSVGKTVILTRTNRRTGEMTEERAVIRSGPDGVVFDVDGRIEALKCAGVAERLVFLEKPEGLTDKPTLSMLVRARTPGRYTVRLTYLALGLNWSADYVAQIRPDGRTLDLTGWVTLANQTGSGFADVPTAVVAGRLSREEDETQPPDITMAQATARCWPTDSTHDYLGRGHANAAAAPPPPPPPPPAPVMAVPAGGADEIVVTAQKRTTQSELGDYKLYTLPEPTTVAAHQTKQVMMLQERAVPFERVYTYDARLENVPGPDPAPAAYADGESFAPNLVLRLINKPENGLGKPLPAGTVSVMEPTARGPVLAGQDSIQDMAVGLPVELKIGWAMDIEVRPVLLSDEEKGKGGRRRRTVEVTITNNKPVAVVFEYRTDMGWNSGKLIATSRHNTTKGGRPLWVLRLKPGESARFSYTIEDQE